MIEVFLNYHREVNKKYPKNKTKLFIKVNNLKFSNFFYKHFQSGLIITLSKIDI